MAVPVFSVGLEVVWMFLDDDAWRPLLDPDETRLGFSQILILSASLAASTWAFYSIFDVNGMPTKLSV
jgi:hypothetical protein